MKYATLAELREAYRFPEDARRPGPLMIDNDSVSATTGNDEEDNYEDVFEMHPAQLMEEALALLGIPFEHV
jgi:hypothetical protein